MASAACAAAAPSCTTSVDCNYAGQCVNGTCLCNQGYTGQSCQSLLMEAYECGKGGLCLSNGSTTWGGSVVQADDGSWHMYAAMMTGNATLKKWLTNSVVLHAVAPGATAAISVSPPPPTPLTPPLTCCNPGVLPQPGHPRDPMPQAMWPWRRARRQPSTASCCTTLTPRLVLAASFAYGVVRLIRIKTDLHAGDVVVVLRHSHWL
jgi:hypothetical protein